MKLKYLGTAAAEAIPSLFCKCRVCQSAWQNGGKEIRSRAQALVNNEVLFDFGPDAFMHSIKYGVHYEDLKFTLITHAHGDHFAPEELYFLVHGYAADIGNHKFKLYLGQSAYDTFTKMIADREYDDRIDIHLVEPYVEYKEKNYTFVPLKANHSAQTTPYIYLLNDGNKTMLYAHDTGVFPDETWEYLVNNKVKLDMISLDLTCQVLSWGRDGHLCFTYFKEVINKLKENKIINDNTIVIANHFSHNGQATYYEMKELAEKENVIVSYDGMEVEF